MEKIGIGLVGYGGIGKVHTLGYKQLPFLYSGPLGEVKTVAVLRPALSGDRYAYFPWAPDVAIEGAGSEKLQLWYEMFSRTMKRKGIKSGTFEYFKSLFAVKEEAGQTCRFDGAKT